jgi:hypothetical protein
VLSELGRAVNTLSSSENGSVLISEGEEAVGKGILCKETGSFLETEFSTDIRDDAGVDSGNVSSKADDGGEDDEVFNRERDIGGGLEGTDSRKIEA